MSNKLKKRVSFPNPEPEWGCVLVIYPDGTCGYDDSDFPWKGREKRNDNRHTNIKDAEDVT